MSHMITEIRQQPDVIKELVASERGNIESLVREVKSRGIEFIVIAARGTSDNAGIFGKYLFDINNGMPTALAAMSAVTLYKAKLKLQKALVIGISQSGQAADVAEYLESARSQGALTAAITNEAGSRITKESDFTILCHAGKEKSVAATKTYTSSLAALYMISAGLSEDSKMVDQLLSATEPMRKVIELDDFIRDRALRYRYMDECYVLARGINYATAFEAALKMSETCRLGAKPYSAADFLHGPIAVVGQGTPCFLFAPDGKGYKDVLDIAHKLRGKGAELIIAANNQEILDLATTAFRLPEGVEEIVSPLVYIIAGQLFAYHLAMIKGYDPDRPEGLSKVTVTR
jgi:glutamine---fructose-6-phosphate transaminase (isomerizing)